MIESVALFKGLKIAAVETCRWYPNDSGVNCGSYIEYFNVCFVSKVVGSHSYVLDVLLNFCFIETFSYFQTEFEPAILIMID